jgi:transposase-like protein
VKTSPDRPKGKPLTEDEKKQARAWLAEQVSVSEVARRIGVGTSTITRLRKREGLGSTPLVDNSAGTQQFKRDAAAKRAQRQAAFDELFEWRLKILTDVKAGGKYKTLVKIPGGGEITEQLSYIPAADLRSEMAVLAQLDQSINRNDDRADDGGLARAQSMLTTILRGLTANPPEIEDGVINR